MSLLALNSRRNFIKTFTFATVCSRLLGKEWVETLAAEIRPMTISGIGIIRLKLADFPALQSESGSVRVGINPLRNGPPVGPTPVGQFYPVVINRAANNTFYALNSRCTHESCVVDPMDAFSNQIFCQCHGSVFGIDGRRLSGPAPSALQRYTITFDGKDRLEVQIPGLGYTVVGSSVQGAANSSPRFRLDFRTFRSVDYEVQFRASLSAPPVPVPFSTTATGPTDQLVFTPTTNISASLYVDRGTGAGFYTVAIRVTEM
jgi:Rieske Fe-S protein